MHFSLHWAVHRMLLRSINAPLFFWLFTTILAPITQACDHAAQACSPTPGDGRWHGMPALQGWQQQFDRRPTCSFHDHKP
jgi:hypothetical protein